MNVVRTNLSSNRGLSLVELLVALGLMSIMGAGFASMMVSQNKEMRAVSEKLAVQESIRLLSVSLSSGRACRYALNNPTPLTFDTTAAFPQTIDIGAQVPPRPIHTFINDGPPVVVGPVLAGVGTSISSLAPQVLVSGIRLVITGGSGTEYVGNWVIDLNPAQMVRAIKPISIATSLNVDNSVPTATRIVSCLEPAAPLPQQWYSVIGSRANGGVYQNTSALPMEVSATATGFQPWAYLLMYVGPTSTGPWVNVDYVACYDSGSVNGTVPPGSWYRIVMGGSMAGARTINRWVEFR